MPSSSLRNALRLRWWLVSSGFSVGGARIVVGWLGLEIGRDPGGGKVEERMMIFRG